MSNDDLRMQLEEIKKQIIQVRKDIAGVQSTTIDGQINLSKAILVDRQGQISDKNEQILEMQLSDLRHTRSEFTLYYSIFLSAIIGVLGNWYVNLLFQPPSEIANFGLTLASVLLLGILLYLSIRMFSVNREFKKQAKKLKETFKRFTEKDKIEA